MKVGDSVIFEGNEYNILKIQGIQALISNNGQGRQGVFLSRLSLKNEVDDRKQTEDAQSEAKADIEKNIDEAFGLNWTLVSSGRAAQAKPNETFWRAWRAMPNRLRNLGYKVSKEKTYIVYVPVDFITGLVKLGDKLYPLDPSPPQADQEETLRDDLGKGLYSPGAANNLRHEHLDADSKEFLAIHGYIED